MASTHGTLELTDVTDVVKLCQNERTLCASVLPLQAQDGQSPARYALIQAVPSGVVAVVLSSDAALQSKSAPTYWNPSDALPLESSVCLTCAAVRDDGLVVLGAEARQVGGPVSALIAVCLDATASAADGDTWRSVTSR